MAAALQSRTMRLGELLGSAAGGQADIEIHDLVMDSRDVSPGAAFLALRGGKAHGLEFAPQAIHNGATVVLYDPAEGRAGTAEPSLAVPGLRRRLADLARKFYGSQADTAEITAVTGTNGKTTVAYVIAQALTALNRECAYIGTLGFGVPPKLTEHRLTTPDCLTLHKEIASLPATDVALEVSSHALAQQRIEGLTIRSAVFTNLTRDHLDEHGSFANYARTKAMLFKWPGLEHAIVNLDDPFAAELIAVIEPTVRVLGVSTEGHRDADLHAAITARDAHGMELAISCVDGSAVLKTPLVGAFNAQNLLSALGVLLCLDIPLLDACEALAGARPPPGRMEVFSGGEAAPAVIVDYAHTPDALARVLDTIADLGAHEVWCVFGCGGDRDPGKRPLMGRAAAERADHIVLTDDNPRSENAAAIVAAIRAGIGPHADVVVEHDRGAAIVHAIRAALPEDIVLVAGKGHERRQRFAGYMRPFEDREAVLGALGRPS